MTTLAQWYHQQPGERQLTEQAHAVYARVSGATLSDILNRSQPAARFVGDDRPAAAQEEEPDE